MRRGQSLVEYSILLIIVAAAFMTMQFYMKRGFQGRWKDAADQLGEQYDTSGFTGETRHTFDSNSMSMTRVQYDQTYNGRQGMITYREDSAITTEKREGFAHVAPAP